ncbi:tyrosine-type recombinase/integrase [Mycobacterium intracellulare]|uniref:tyrosine-type recombinase/integrase n=2 Tax=Mycobacterium intracellulare TaxID=1767 RepID=UPI001FF708E9|nr:site-specific integrase [Mycobacterium intracellulare]
MVKRSSRAGVEDRWHRPPRKAEQVPYPADSPGRVAGTWCMDPKHGTPGTLVCTVRHGSGRRWLARWVDNHSEERTESFDRKSDAQACVNQVTSDLVTHAYADPRKSAVTFRMISEEWMATQRTRLKPSTIGGYESLLKMTVWPRWGDVKLADIAHVDIQQWVVWMTTNKEARQPRTTDKAKNAKRTPLSARRAVQAHGMVKQVLAYAVRTKRLAVNPADGIERPRVVHRRETALTHAQVAALVEAAADAGPIVQALAYTGLRFGELAALRVGDVDLSRRRILVSKGVSQVTGIGLVEDTTKTHQVRTVPILTSALVDTLKAAVAGRGPQEYLFPAPSGGPMRNSFFRWRLDRAADSAGIAGISIKTLRHSAGSLALASGASLPTTSRLLGHAKVSTTADVYSHMLPDDFDHLADAMDKAARAASI